MSASNGPISDDDRDKLEEALATALLLIYAGKRAQALSQLGQTVDALDVPPAASQKVLDFARERARLIQEGVNERMNGADDPTAAASEIDEYNATVLQPYVDSWASHAGLIDGLESVSMGGGKTALTNRPDGSVQLWTWEQQGEFPDDCADAMAASPAPFSDLMDIAGGPPPRHPRCNCVLSQENSD